MNIYKCCILDLNIIEALKQSDYSKELQEEVCQYISDIKKEIERLNNIINKLEDFIEKEIELYTVELTEKNINTLGYTAPIRGVYKEINNIIQELKDSDN